MTEGDAKALVKGRFGADVTERLALFLARVVEENARQNLISASTIESIWSRHAMDSLQLVELAEGRPGRWIDIGSGGGFPGLPVAIARPEATLLVEPRRKRAEFLERMVEELGLADRVNVAQQRIEKVERVGAILSARAVAGIEALFTMAHHCVGPETRWLLPRGTIGPEEIQQLRRHWTFVFHVEQSRVSESSAIAIFDKVQRR